MRIVFCGSGTFAVQSLRAVLESEHDVVGVFTQPARKAGRGGHLRPTPIFQECQKLGISAIECEDIKNCLTSTNLPSGCDLISTGLCIKEVDCEEEEEEENVTEEEEVCDEDWTCEGYGECQADGYKYPINCIDNNNCGTTREKPIPILCACTPVLECGDWGNCRADYDITQLVEGKYIEASGIQKRS